MKTFERIYQIGNLLFGIGLSTVLSALFYVAFLEKPFLRYEGLPHKVVGDGPFKAGQVVPLHVRRCNTDKYSHSYPLSHAVQNLDTGAFTAMPESYVMIPPGCHNYTSLTHVLPASLEPGRYKLFGGAHVHGIIRMYNVNWDSQEFEVVP